MRDFILNNLSNKFLSRWVVLIYDVLITSIAYVFAVFIRHEFEYLTINPELIASQFIIVFLIYGFFYLRTKSYTGVIRQTGLTDAMNILKACSYAFLVLVIINTLNRFGIISSKYIPPLSVIMIHFMLLAFFLIGNRLLIKAVYSEIISKKDRKRMRVLIYGAGSTGLLTLNALRHDQTFQYTIVAFVDDNPSIVNKMLDGIIVVAPEKALNANYIQKNSISDIIIAIPNLDTNHKREIIEKGLEYNLQVKVVPPIDNWINGELSSTQLREVHIEELLGREPIKLDNKNIAGDIRNNTIMVTGAAGSIGSEIVRQLLHYDPKKVILVDQAESAIFDLQFEINNTPEFSDITGRVVYQVANIKDQFRMEGLFKEYQPQIIYHAAAYKHVPLMEENPYEAITVNVFGTKVIADLALKHQTKKVVIVSTDKAVNPTNVMGASKRIAEIYIQSVADDTTRFITTRFGNVLGSNGSVIPIFRKQIESGGPVTVTHKEITRYFMTIPEACNLVMEAGAMGKGGEIFVFDMGKSVKIYELARRMIQLSGLVPDKDIKIVEIGLRPGEKLYEELLLLGENLLPTHHPKIMKAKVRVYTREEAETYLNQLSEIIVENDIYALVKKMKEIVPEYLSNNSVFSTLDQQKEESKNS